MAAFLVKKRLNKKIILTTWTYSHKNIKFCLTNQKEKIVQDDFKILIVDDDPDIREVFADRLCLEGYQSISEAGSAEDALELIDKQTYDLIISDLLMGGMNGVEFYHALKEKKNETPFMMVTGSDAEDVCASLPQEVGVIKKPFHFSDIIHNIEKNRFDSSLQ